MYNAAQYVCRHCNTNERICVHIAVVNTHNCILALIGVGLNDEEIEYIQMTKISRRSTNEDVSDKSVDRCDTSLYNRIMIVTRRHAHRTNIS